LAKQQCILTQLWSILTGALPQHRWMLGYCLKINHDHSCFDSHDYTVHKNFVIHFILNNTLIWNWMAKQPKNQWLWITSESMKLKIT
jgi:hypothetical protein